MGGFLLVDTERREVLFFVCAFFLIIRGNSCAEYGQNLCVDVWGEVLCYGVGVVFCSFPV